MPTALADRPWARPWIAVALLCVAAWGIRVAANAPRTGVDHGDSAFYVNVARNLLDGRGFVLDYVSNFWHHPDGIPTPSNTWWMPLPSLIAALGMALGGGGYGAAQHAMIALASLLPALVYLLARDLGARTGTALLAALLAVAFYRCTDEPCTPLSQGPVMIFSAAAWICALRAARSPGWSWAAGIAVGLATLARSDGIVLLVPVLLVLGRGGLSRPLRAARVAAGFGLTMAPWWLHNIAQFGTPTPAPQLHAMLMRRYEDWYALPDTVNWSSFTADGWRALVSEKLAASAANGLALVNGAFSGVGDTGAAWVAWGAVAWLLLSWLGWLALLGRRTRFVWAHAIALWLLYSWVYTGISDASFRAAIFALFPALLCGMAFAAARIGRRAAGALPAGPARLGGRVALAALLLWLLAAQVAQGEARVRSRAGFIASMTAFHAELGAFLRDELKLSDPVLLACNTHELYALTGLRCVQLPIGPPADVRAVARRFGASHVLITAGDPARIRNGLRASLGSALGARRVPAPASLAGTAFELYALPAD